ncbi:MULTISPECIES: peroxiredoxin family protein [Salinibaculum]|uniref:peroxiredoxin family protein n=1 Tax=Salinibaculum TaxID=2732368 RepID=UPI0030D1CA69
MAEPRPTLDFSLPNVGPGPDPWSLSTVAADHDFVVVYLQRDHLCTNCRKQVQQVADRYADFRDRGAEVVSVVPEPREKVEDWQDSYDLPYPLLADPDVAAGDLFDQPVRFGFLGSISDFLGRMPEVVVLDARDGEPRVAWTYSGRSTFDRPDVDDVLAELDGLREGATT